MSKKYRLPVLLAAAVLLVGCGGNSSDYSKYVQLGTYKGLDVKMEVEDVTDEELEEYEEEQLGNYVSYEEVEGPVKEGQLVQVSLLAEEGSETVYDFSDEDGYEMVIGKGDFGAEVDDALLGGVVGDELDFSVSYDNEVEDALLCDKNISYHIEIEKISDVIYPELTNEFVKENFGETSVEAWQNTLREELQSQHQADATDQLRSDLVQKVIDGSNISGYPKKLYKQKKQEVEEGYQSYADMFGCSLDEIYDMLEIDEAARKQEYLDATYQAMVLAMIRQQENITLPEEELQEKLENFAQENDYGSVDELLAEYTKESMADYFLEEMTLDFLEENANISM